MKEFIPVWAEMVAIFSVLQECLSSSLPPSSQTGPCAVIASPCGLLFPLSLEEEGNGEEMDSSSSLRLNKPIVSQRGKKQNKTGYQK